MTTELYALAIPFDGPDPTLVQSNGQGLPTQLVEIPDIPSGGLGPLARTRWIDGNTTVPSSQQNGTEGAPYSSPEAFLATLTPEPVSADDAATLWVGLISPTADDIWAPNPQTWVIPPGRSVVIRNLTSPGIPVTTGHLTVPAPESADFTDVTITWTNTAATGSPPSAVLTLDNLGLIALALTQTDGAGAPPSALILLGSTGFYQGTVNVSGSSNFKTLLVMGGATANLGITNPVSGPTFGLVVSGGSWTSSGLVASSVTATNASITDTGSFLQTSGGQTYTGCTITANGLRTTGTSALIFSNCTFTRGTTLNTSIGPGSVQFDGPSWASFKAAGGGTTTGTVITVVGGYSGGAVVGATIANPAGNANTVSINGTGASGGFTGGGNWYTCTSLAGNTSTTIVDGGGAVTGTTMRFTRTDASGNTWTILDAGTGSIASVPAGGSTTVYYNGTGWVLQ
jgi:hypothetical protein